eukprot:CAMPEP_0201211050 /NCGR_PEP_ID=MMETSP0851-20130426/181522_1 /ASSEMBLY_ACC=CAM_ASM_000631 /TAXON_ID=183588 /ORGANISM="Pseudo-nitzschia fraudulenta, Strain WWA7" /LENGTH=233 /DNA_ID=CAMNT_0047499933 /DNA_START=174 /DNA_END=878 /DNA_ORIENTATION=+
MAAARVFAPAAAAASDEDTHGIRCLGLGLRVPYLGSESCQTLGLPNHFDVGYTSVSANNSVLGTAIARAFTILASKPGDVFETPGLLFKVFVDCLNPGALNTIARLAQTDHPKLMECCKIEIERSVVHSVQGILYNYATDTLIDQGFEITDTRPDLPVVVWYAEDDEDCPPSHGKWIATGKKDGDTNDGSDSKIHFTNVVSRVFTDSGHLGAAFIQHDEFLKQVHDHTPLASS